MILQDDDDMQDLLKETLWSLASKMEKYYDLTGATYNDGVNKTPLSVSYTNLMILCKTIIVSLSVSFQVIYKVIRTLRSSSLCKNYILVNYNRLIAMLT